MKILMVRSRVKPEHVMDVEAAVQRLFSSIEHARPANVRYASSMLPDGETFLALLQVEEGTENPLPALPAFREFQERLKAWVAGPPVAEQLTVVGSYRLFG